MYSLSRCDRLRYPGPKVQIRTCDRQQDDGSSWERIDFLVQIQTSQELGQFQRPSKQGVFQNGLDLLNFDFSFSFAKLVALICVSLAQIANADQSLKISVVQIASFYLAYNLYESIY